MKNIDFWEQQQQVERFAALEPDLRLLEILKTYQNPEKIKVFDLGCAGGRNSYILAEKGFDFYSIDSSKAMVKKTRERVSKYIGTEKAKERVTINFIDNLSIFPSENFDLIIAIGIYHNAINMSHWQKTIKESNRVLKKGGQVLISSISPKSKIRGREFVPVKNKKHIYEGVSSGRLLLLTAEEIEKKMTSLGFLPVVPAKISKTKTDRGIRVMINSHYYKN